MPVEEQEAFSVAFWQAEPFKSMRQFFTLEVSNLPWYKCRFKRSNVHIKNRLLPVNLRHAHYESDDDFVVNLGVSPTVRLTHKGVYLDSVELAEEFAQHLTSVFDKRKYKSNYEIKVVVRKSTCTKTVTRHKIADSQKVREYLAK